MLGFKLRHLSHLLFFGNLKDKLVMERGGRKGARQHRHVALVDDDVKRRKA